MIKVANAVILAAGRGRRLAEITENTPKPLIYKDEVTLLEHIVNALRIKLINDIVVVIGYKAEKFMPIIKKLQVKSAFNADWETTNNVSSFQVALPYISDTLIVNGDILMHANPFANVYKSACTYAEYSAQGMDEWLIEINGDQNITNFIRSGERGAGLYQREVTFITKPLALAMKKNLPDFRRDEYYELLALQAAQENHIPFQAFNIKAGILCDVDNKEDFIKHKLSI